MWQMRVLLAELFVCQQKKIRFSLFLFCPQSKLGNRTLLYFDKILPDPHCQFWNLLLTFCFMLFFLAKISATNYIFREISVLSSKLSHLTFDLSFILNGPNHVTKRTWRCSECSKKSLEQLQILMWHNLSHLEWKKNQTFSSGK